MTKMSMLIVQKLNIDLWNYSISLFAPVSNRSLVKRDDFTDESEKYHKNLSM